MKWDFVSALLDERVLLLRMVAFFLFFRSTLDNDEEMEDAFRIIGAQNIWRRRLLLYSFVRWPHARAPLSACFIPRWWFQKSNFDCQQPSAIMRKWRFHFGRSQPPDEKWMDGWMTEEKGPAETRGKAAACKFLGV
jgi:hypothetical protein